MLKSVTPSFLIKTIVFSLLLITLLGQLLDWVFYSDQSEQAETNYIQQYKVIVSTLSNTSPEKRSSLLNEAKKYLSIDIELLNRDDFNLNAQEKSPFFLTANDDSFYLCWPIDQQVIKIGPLENQENSYLLTDLIIRVFFYCLIIGVILYFLLPLTNDLDKLSSAVTEYQVNNQLNIKGIKKNSPIYPLVKTFRDLVNKVEDMLSYQSSMYKTISHELRTPLSRIKFSVELLDKKALSKEDETYVEGIQDNLKSLEELIDQILSFSKIENTKELLKLERFELQHLLVKLKESFNSQLYAKNIHIEIMPSLNEQFIQADLNLVFIAISNIIQNGLVYAKSQVKVVIAHEYSQSFSDSQLEASNILIMIEDDGAGIDNAQLEKLYKPFSDVKLRPDGSKSYGFGLAISKQIITLHNGNIIYKNSELGGAKFIVELPFKNL